ncbi:MAG: hypothetical protein M3O22_00930 [Pseudomonadota bacterium]|nr:hypothetical protein [Pseudomonadota bacterium]
MANGHQHKQQAAAAQHMQGNASVLFQFARWLRGRPFHTHNQAHVDRGPEGLNVLADPHRNVTMRIEPSRAKRWTVQGASLLTSATGNAGLVAAGVTALCALLAVGDVVGRLFASVGEVTTDAREATRIRNGGVEKPEFVKALEIMGPLDTVDERIRRTASTFATADPLISGQTWAQAGREAADLGRTLLKKENAHWAAWGAFSLLAAWGIGRLRRQHGLDAVLGTVRVIPTAIAGAAGGVTLAGIVYAGERAVEAGKKLRANYIAAIVPRKPGAP